MSDDLTALSISEAASLIAARKLSPVELTSAVLERVERPSPQLNAYILVTAEEAMAAAKRAEAVLKYLQDGGVTNTMTSRGYGERQPIASNNTEDGRLQNRRVVLRALN